jgi:transposase
MEEDYGKLRVTAVLRNGRCRYDPISKARLVDACLEPGASVARLALDHGVNANLLRKWVKDRKARGAIALGSTSTSAFIPVRVENTEQDLRRVRELCAPELSTPSNAQDRSSGDRQRRFSSPAPLQARLPNGVTLTVSCGDAAALTTLIEALSDVQTGR